MTATPSSSLPHPSCPKHARWSRGGKHTCDRCVDRWGLEGVGEQAGRRTAISDHGDTTNETQNPRHGFPHMQFRAKIRAGSGDREKETESGQTRQELRPDLAGNGEAKPQRDPSLFSSTNTDCRATTKQAVPWVVSVESGLRLGLPGCLMGREQLSPSTFGTEARRSPWRDRADRKNWLRCYPLRHLTRLLNTVPSGPTGQISAPSEPLRGPQGPTARSHRLTGEDAATCILDTAQTWLIQHQLLSLLMREQQLKKGAMQGRPCSRVSGQSQGWKPRGWTLVPL